MGIAILTGEITRLNVEAQQFLNDLGNNDITTLGAVRNLIGR